MGAKSMNFKQNRKKYDIGLIFLLARTLESGYMSLYHKAIEKGLFII